jgi:hypothetical protein
MNKKIILIIVAGVSVVAIAETHFSATMKSVPSVSSIAGSSSTPPGESTACLASDQIASYAATWNKSALDVGTVTITDKTHGDIVSKFQINGVFSQHYHAYEIHRCAIYVLRQFNYDYRHGDPLSNYRQELWKFNYVGVGTKLTEAYDYRVSPDESVIAFSPFYDNVSNPSVLFEDLKTSAPVFTLHLSDIPKASASIIGNFDFQNGGWSSDSRYFWLDSNQAADVIGFMRIDTRNWAHQIFSAPSITMGGDALNPNTGMVTYRTNAAPWTADAEIDQQYRNAATQSGQITSFNIYDFLTNENYVIATSSDPVYYYRPRWISDTVLEYTLTSGKTATYTIH